jgi:segregation and condensation protein A
VDNQNGLQLALMSEALLKARAFDTDDSEKLTVNVGEFEGPLDVLLVMARKQKVDLLKISISQLVDQYLVFIKAAQDIRLELAADYLVMAAWLAYLKSALLLPVDEQPKDEIDAETLAMRLQFQIARLDAVRDASARLMALPQKNIDFFTRGYIENRSDRVKTYYKDTLYDLLATYGEQKMRNTRKTYHVRPPKIMSIEEAIARLLPKINNITEWTNLKNFLPTLDDQTPIMQKSVIAGTFVACLELAKRGILSIKQDSAYGELSLKSRG